MAGDFSTAKASYRGIFSLFPILKYGFPSLQKVCEIIKKNIVFPSFLFSLTLIPQSAVVTQSS